MLNNPWSDKINATLLDVDQWFGTHGHVIPETPRAELEGHLRRLSEEIHGYDSFLGGKPTTFGLPESDGDDGPEVRWLEADPREDGPDIAFAQGAANDFYASQIAAAHIPVIPFGRDAELAQRAMQRRASSAERFLAAIITITLLLILAYFLFGIFGALADERHDRHMAEYHSTPAEADYFNNLQSPTGGSCCGENDCSRTEAEWRQNPDGTWGWWAIVKSVNKGAVWTRIPDSQVVKSQKSLDGEAYVCASEGSEGGVGYSPGANGMYTMPPLEPMIYCFVPPNLGT